MTWQNYIRGKQIPIILNSKRNYNKKVAFTYLFFTTESLPRSPKMFFSKVSTPRKVIAGLGPPQWVEKKKNISPPFFVVEKNVVLQ